MKNNLEESLSGIQLYNLNDYTVVVFGAGNTSVLYQKCFEREGIHPVYYIDNSESKQDTVFQNVPVVSVEKLVSLQETFSKPVLVLICSANISVCSQMRLQLQEYGLAYTIIDAFVFGKNKDKIERVYNSLEDDFSKEVYAQIIQSRLNNSLVPESIVSSGSYFLLPQFLERSEKEIFVDLGAYVGDTLEQYIIKKLGVFNKIYAFEPDPLNFSAMQHRTMRIKNEWALSEDKLCIINAGVGLQTKQQLFSPPPLSNQNNSAGNTLSNSARLGANFVNDKNDGSKEIMIYALDDYFKEQQVGFIKADIESYELDMLHGAESIIKRDRPLLAVCIYHNASDMFAIPLFVKELCNDYRFKIRHHTYDFAETVLYVYV